jgi:tape measure domain-containing protein
MPSITALNVRLGMDVSNFSEGANLAKNEVTKVATIMRQSVPPAEKYKQELDLVNRAFSETGKQSVQYGNAVESLNQKYKQGQHSAEAVAKAQAEIARTAAVAAEAEKRLKDETARLAEAEKQHNAVMDKGKAVTQSAATASESYSRKIRELQALLRAGAISQETYRRSVEQTTKAMRETSTASGSAMSSIKGLAAAYLGVQTVAKSISLSNEVEDATIAFEVLTGSAKDGAIIFEQIRKFAAESPVTFSGATQAAKTMISFNVAAQDVEANLRMLSDVTGGNNERFKMMSLAFSQMSAAGRLMGQDLLQMVNAGFNPLQQISKTTGESMIELKKRMEDGGISTEEVRKAFQDATAEGGMFHGMTERLSETVSGKMNIALSDMEQMLARVGEELGPLIIQLLGVANDLKPAFEVVLWIIRKISEGLGFTIAVWTDLINSVTNFEIDMTATDKFLDDLEKRNRELAAAENNQVQGVLDEKLNAVNEVAKAEREAAKKTEDEHQKAIEKTLKETDELVKKARQDAEDAEKNWQRELTDARKAAMDFFEERQKANEQRRADAARGPGAGMEAGSAEAVKFAADAVNARIAGAAVPDSPEATNREIAAKTVELLEAQREANAQQARQIQLAERQLKEMEENGFRRLR